MRTNYHRVLALMHGDLRNGTEAGLAHGFKQQMVRLLASFFRHHKVRCVKVDGIDAFRFDELKDLHVVAGGGRNLLHFFVIDDDVSIFFDFEAFDQLTAFNDPVALRAKRLLLDTASADLMNLVKAYALRTRRREQTDRNGNQSEGDISFPDCGSHNSS